MDHEFIELQLVARVGERLTVGVGYGVDFHARPHLELDVRAVLSGDVIGFLRPLLCVDLRRRTKGLRESRLHGCAQPAKAEPCRCSHRPAERLGGCGARADDIARRKAVVGVTDQNLETAFVLTDRQPLPVPVTAEVGSRGESFSVPIHCDVDGVNDGNGRRGPVGLPARPGQVGGIVAEKDLVTKRFG